MVSKRKRASRPPRARNLCQQFSGVISRCAHAGVGAIQADHQTLINGLNRIVCSVNLDACRRSAEPNESRWDYIMIAKHGTGPGLALEVHHAVADEVTLMIRKKAWALALLARECPRLVVQTWSWVVPKGQEPFFTPDDPQAFKLYDAGIQFPAPSLTVP